MLNVLTELFFDIETDPLRDICYLHGFLERRNKDTHTERYVAFFSDQPNEQEEKLVFSQLGNLFKIQCPVSFIIIHPMKKPNGRNCRKNIRMLCPKTT